MGVREIVAVSGRAVFLDRDGVLNQAVVRNGRPYPPASLAGVRLIPGIEQCLADLKAAGFLLIVVTNQPDVARSTQTREAVEEMHAFLMNTLPLDHIFVCYHDDPDHCDCRKPLPGLLLQAAQKYNIDLHRSFLIGDRWRDVEAGRRAGCVAVFINYGYAEQRPDTPDFEARSVREATGWILTSSARRERL